MLLLPILCKTEKEGYKFIRTGKDIVSLGHTQGNAWIKPYKCYPNLFSRSAFANENELYTYKIDCVMLLMIKLCRYFGHKKILNVIEGISKFDSNNAQKRTYKTEFFKKSEEFEDDLI